MLAIGITTGDPKGIGPEVVAQALQHFPNGHFQIFGPLQSNRLLSDKEGAEIALESLQSACRAIREKTISALVTAPVNKQRMRLVDASFTGHTEFFAREFDCDVTMMFTAPELKVSLVTRHLPLKEVASHLNRDLVCRTIRQTADGLKKLFGIENPRLAVAGLNPHAGEKGMMGDEESKIIAPAMQHLCSEGLQVSGPFSPDTVFWRAMQGEFDAVVAMYHDQGLIAVKTMAFHEAVQVTLGLPFLRVSVDHGTAEDLVGTGRVNCDNLQAAIRLVRTLTTQSI